MLGGKARWVSQSTMFTNPKNRGSSIYGRLKVVVSRLTTCSETVNIFLRQSEQLLPILNCMFEAVCEISLHLLQVLALSCTSVCCCLQILSTLQLRPKRPQKPNCLALPSSIVPQPMRLDKCMLLPIQIFLSLSTSMGAPTLQACTST